MDKRQKQQREDQHAFRQAMESVTPLTWTATTDSRSPGTNTKKTTTVSDIAPVEPAWLTERGNRGSVNTDDGSSHRKNGVQKRVLQKLKRGHFKVSDQLDLHSMNLEFARQVLIRFIDDSQHQHYNCVRVIHGKGLRSLNGPRLKLMTRQMLREHPQVLAFTTCKPANGGNGAVEILLKSG